jgi:hypothetical protein
MEVFFGRLRKTSSGTFVAHIGLSNYFTFSPLLFRWCSFNTPPHSLKDSNVSLKVKTMKEKKVGVYSLACSTSGVKGYVGALGWGLG